VSKAQEYFTELTVITFVGERVAMSQISEEQYGEPIAYGEAVRHPDDKNDPVVGSKLATGRALQKLGRKLEREARAITAQRDNDRKQREQASADKANLEELPKPNSRRGPKLNKEIAEDIRHLWRVGHTIGSLADDFGVTEKSIRSILNNKTYVS